MHSSANRLEIRQSYQNKVLEIRHSLANKLEIRHSLANKQEIIDSLANKIEIRHSLANKQEIIDSLANKIEIRHSLANKQEIIDSLANKVGRAGEQSIENRSDAPDPTFCQHQRPSSNTVGTQHMEM
jgi:uncharacterized coiled-coil protein SlyX